jgi:hypothetical protein
MTEPTSDKIVIGAIGSLVTTVIGAAIGWFGWSGSIGAPLTTLLAAVGGISGLVKRYIGVLGAGGEAKGSPGRAGLYAPVLKRLSQNCQMRAADRRLDGNLIPQPVAGGSEATP